MVPTIFILPFTGPGLPYISYLRVLSPHHLPILNRIEYCQLIHVVSLFPAPVIPVMLPSHTCCISGLLKRPQMATFNWQVLIVNGLPQMQFQKDSDRTPVRSATPGTPIPYTIICIVRSFHQPAFIIQPGWAFPCPSYVHNTVDCQPFSSTGGLDWSAIGDKAQWTTMRNFTLK